MTICEVGFKVSDSIYSVNMIWSNTGENEIEAIKDSAERKAEKHGYEVAYIKPLLDCEVDYKFAKGIPLYPFDSEAEEKYDPSFRNCPA